MCMCGVVWGCGVCVCGGRVCGIYVWYVGVVDVCVCCGVCVVFVCGTCVCGVFVCADVCLCGVRYVDAISSHIAFLWCGALLFTLQLAESTYILRTLLK